MHAVPRTFRWLLRASALLTGVLLLLALRHASVEGRVLGRWSPSYAGFLAAIAGAALVLGLACARERHVWRARAKLAALLGSTLAALVIADLVLRWLDPLGLEYYRASAEYAALRRPDDVLAYVQPRSLTVELDGVDVRFNALGLRGEEVPVKLPGEVRILALGDSVVFGWAVAEEELFVHRLASMLGQALGRGVRAVNAGVCSYDIRQERLYLEHRGLALDPDLVLLVLVNNDVLDCVPPRPPTAAPPVTSAVRDLGRWLGESGLAGTLSHALESRSATSRLRGPEQRLGPEDPSWQRNLRALEELVGLCNARGIPLAIFHFRWTADPWSDALLAALREHAAPIPVADTVAWWAGADWRDLIHSTIDLHPNARGHALAAARMYELIEEHALLQALK